MSIKFSNSQSLGREGSESHNLHVHFLFATRTATEVDQSYLNGHQLLLAPLDAEHHFGLGGKTAAVDYDIVR